VKKTLKPRGTCANHPRFACRNLCFAIVAKISNGDLSHACARRCLIPLHPVNPVDESFFGNTQFLEFPLLLLLGQFQRRVQPEAIGTLPIPKEFQLRRGELV
jgi:hypothetical protein